MDTAMDTGSDAGEPGERPADDRPLGAQERAVLAALADAGPGRPAADEGEPAVRAAADDTVLPLPPPAGGDDGLAPPFQEPTDT